MKLKKIVKLYRLKFKLLLRRRTIFFDEKGVFDNKRVIIIGPAPSSMNYLPGHEIDKFDLIVRVNRSPQVVPSNKSSIGSRTDILIHGMKEGETDEILTFKHELLEEQKIKWILYPSDEPRWLYHFYRAALKYNYPFILRLNPKWYKLMKKDMSSRLPTTGFQAISYLLRQNFRELHIVGFTFFQTGYLPGYNDKFKNAKEVFNSAIRAGNHDPNEELKRFILEYSEAKSRGKLIVLDTELSRIVIENS